MTGGELRGRGDGWCILRTSGQRTIPLVRSLTRAGFDVWTPEDVIPRRRPRSSVCIPVEIPIIPTFVFARAAQVAQIARLMMADISPHPPFSIFKHGGRYPIIADREIAGLRKDEEDKRLVREKAAERERLAAMKAIRQSFDNGARVVVKDGAWHGMTGVVEASAGRSAYISFGGTTTVTIDTWLLRLDELDER